MLHQFKTLLVSSLIIIAMLTTQACKVDGEHVANVNARIADVLRPVASATETLLFDPDLKMTPAEVNRILEPGRQLAEASKGVAEFQLNGGANTFNVADVIAKGLDTYAQVKPEAFSNPKVREYMAKAKQYAAIAQIGLAASGLKQSKSFLAIKPETRPLVEETFDTAKATADRIVEWQKFYGQK